MIMNSGSISSSTSFFFVLLRFMTLATLSEAACKGPGTYDHWIFFTTPLIAPNGSTTDFATALPGTRWPYAGDFYDAPDSTAATALGYDTDLCTYLSADAPQMWQCTGTYIDSFGCSGYLTFSGFFNISAGSGVFTVLGGTDDFEGATGHIRDVAKEEGWFLRTLVWKKVQSASASASASLTTNTSAAIVATLVALTTLWLI